VGKTSFILQIADHMAKNGQGVLFFSGEMSMLEIYAKSLSRLSKENGKPLTFREIWSNFNKEDVLKENYETKISKNITLIDGKPNLKNETKISIQMDKYRQIVGKSPIVFIDYLQIMNFNKTPSLRNEIDGTISELRILSVKYETPVILISSLNRPSKDDKKILHKSI